MAQAEEARTLAIAVDDEDTEMRALYLAIRCSVLLIKLEKLNELIPKVKNILEHTKDTTSIPYSLLCRGMAQYYTSVRQYDQALTYAKKSLQITRTLSGETSDDTLQSYYRVGMLQFTLNDS